MSSDWVAAAIDWLFTAQPVSATFAGVRGHDAEWPDLSVDGSAATAERAQHLLGTMATTTTGGVQAVDTQLMRNHLEVYLLDAVDRRALRHPALLTGEAVFGVISLLLRDDRPAAERAGLLMTRLRSLPDVLRSGGAALVSTSEPERRRAIAELDALALLLSDRLPLALQHIGAPDVEDVQRAAHDALAAVHSARTGIIDLPATLDGKGDAERFLTRLRLDHQVESDIATLRRWGAVEVAQAQDDLQRAFASAGMRDIPELLAALRADQESALTYDSMFATVWQRAAEHAVQHRIVDWPAWPIVFRPQPVWSHGIASDLYFLLYRCPPAQSRQVVQEYLYPPLGSGVQGDRTLAAVNRSQITLNHVVHHAGLGHHVQNWHAFRSPSRVGRLAGVDVASRILLPCAGTLVEGWACRAPELMNETGFLAPLEQLALLHTRLRLAARAVMDIAVNADGAHAVAAQEFASSVGVPLGVGEDEVLRADLHPGSAIMYLLGQRGLERIAADHGQHPASESSDRRTFHAAVLSHGAIPVASTAQLLRGVDGDAVRPLTLAELIPA